MTAQASTERPRSSRPTEVQILAAQLRVEADEKLGRSTPRDIVEIANAGPRYEDASR